MPHFMVSPKAGITADAYWLDASSPDEARKLVALNVEEASDAGDHKKFDCERNDKKTPPDGLIYRRLRGPVTIAAR